MCFVMRVPAPARVNPKLDMKRPLDRDGKQQCMLLGRYLNALNLQFDVIASSPLKRSLQTAQLVGTEIGHEAKIMVSGGAQPLCLIHRL